MLNSINSSNQDEFKQKQLSPTNKAIFEIEDKSGVSLRVDKKMKEEEKKLRGMVISP